MKTIKLRGRARLFLGAVIFLSPAATMTSGHAQTASASTPHRKAVKSTTRHKTTVTRGTTSGPIAGAQTAPVATTVPSRSQTTLRDVSASNSLSLGMSGKAEEVVVVGSALSTANNTSANPVQIVTAKQIQQTGATTLSDFFQRLPSVGSSSQQNTDTNGGGGVSCTDLRNLGTNRVLVLIDGKRAALNSSSNCFDMNSIPVQQVASVEILKDGGSELYGADAVSGVINIKLRHDLDTGNITVRGGITGHGDAPQGMISGFKGWNFDHSKGNISLFGQYMTQGGVRQRNRSWSRNVQIGDDADPSNNRFGSSYSPYGSFYGLDSGAAYRSDNQGNLVAGTKRFNFAHDSFLTNQLQDSSLSGDAHYDFNDHFTLYSNVLYSHNTSMTQMAAEPVAGAVPQNGPYPTAITIPADYPGNTAGEDLQMLRRMTEWGPRETQTASDTLTAKVGAQGRIYAGWKYDLSYTYGANMYKYQQSNMGSYPALLNTYGLQPTAFGDPNSGMIYNPSVCDAAAGCVLSSPFASLSPAAARYSNLNTTSNGHSQLRDLNLRIHNDHVATMPWAHGGDLGIALGMEHRGEQLTYVPDPALQSGVALTNPQGVTSGGFNVTEGYLEGKATLLRDTFLAKDLTIDAQGRYSSYNTFGSVENWKASINWAPTRDIRFRGTIGTSFRQPSVYELFGAQSLGYATALDPCAGASSPTIVANCMKAGIANPGSFQQQGSGQVATVSGGNAKLQPEAGRTYTFGTVLTPRWIPGLSTSVEFWHYNVSSSVGTLATNYILNNCYNGTNPGLCSLVNRSANGQISQVSAVLQNLGTTNTSGIDWDFDYRIRLTRMDTLTISNSLQNLVNYSQQLVPGGQYYHYTNAIYYPGGTSNPRWRDYATVSWQHGPFSITYMANYTGGVHWNDSSSFMQLSDGYGRVKTPAMVQQDIALGYHVESWNFTGGVNNIANKNPPFFADGGTNTDTSTYSSFVPGRNFWLQISKDF
ncbi:MULTISPECIES: TonB-dependent receptor domain-containing protein [Asaia]|uniref:TonB-dependent receptor domain-containing protein n=1 Tax=Asaia TaxID=91914 RepID=UPI002FC326A3